MRQNLLYFFRFCEKGQRSNPSFDMFFLFIKRCLAHLRCNKSLPCSMRQHARCWDWAVTLLIVLWKFKDIYNNWRRVSIRYPRSRVLWPSGKSPLVATRISLALSKTPNAAESALFFFFLKCWEFKSGGYQPHFPFSFLSDSLLQETEAKS